MLAKQLSAGRAVYPPTTDSNFKQTVLLLHGDGTNGAQNNTFTDSSTNAFSITRTGNTTQGTFTPFSQADGYWSNFFNGSSYLTVANNTALKMGTGDFTVEAWVYITQSGYQTVIGMGQYLSNIGALRIQPDNTLRWYFNDNTVGVTSTNTISLSSWTHICASRVSGTTRVFINGVQGGSFSDSSNYNSTYATTFGAEDQNGYGIQNYVTNGYISNLRVVKGTGVTSVTVPTAPLTAISGTSLLTCQSNRFLDGSTNAFAITTSGSPSVQAFSTFAPSAAYSTSTVGGSGYFDGSGDYLTFTSSSSFSTTGDFTVECWFYFASLSGTNQFFGEAYGTSGFEAIVDSDGSVYTITYTNRVDTGAGEVKAGQWYHYACVRSSGTTKVYLNGVEKASGTLSSTVFNNSATVGIGIRPNVGNYSYNLANAYLCDLRYVKSAVYTGAFTPPTAPLTAISNTQLLLNFTNAGIIDSTAKNDLETVGNAQISTTQKKWGTASLYFDGTGDWLLGYTNSPLFGFETGDFTIEFWAWKSANGSANYDGVITVMDGSTTKWYVELSSSQGFRFYNKSTAQTCQNNTTTGINDSTWHHWAICRYGSTWYLFKDGTALTKTTDTIGASSIGGGTKVYVGNEQDGVDSYPFNGYIDDLRITKGVARYTANFTPPTAAFADY